MQEYEKKIAKYSEKQIVFSKTLELCNNWLKGIDSIIDISRIEHIIQHKLSGYSGHIFYVNTLLNGMEKYYNNSLIKKIAFFVWGKWEYLRSLRIKSEDIIGEFKFSLDKPFVSRTYKTDYCFVVSMENYLRVLVPIVNSLVLNEKRVTIITISDSRLWKVIDEFSEKVNWIYFEESVLNDDKEQYKADLKKFRKSWEKEKIIVKRNVNIVSPYIFFAIKRRLQVIYSIMIPRVMLYERVFTRLFEQMKPEGLIVVRLRRTFDITAVEVAKSKGIKTSLLIHGQIFDNYKFFDSDGFFDTDVVYTWGRFQEEILKFKQQYMQIGVCKNYGNPMWDKLFEKNNKVRNITIDNKNSKKRMLLYMGQNDSFSFFKKFILTVEKMENIVVLVKPHPYENIDKYNEVTERSVAEVEMIDSKFSDIDMLISMSDIAYTYTSTVGLNILLNNVPLVTLNFNKERDVFLTEKIQGAPIVESVEELSFVTQRILSEPNYRQEIIKGQQDFLNFQLECSGMATNRIVSDLLGRGDE